MDFTRRSSTWHMEDGLSRSDGLVSSRQSGDEVRDIAEFELRDRRPVPRATTEDLHSRNGTPVEPRTEMPPLSASEQSDSSQTTAMQIPQLLRPGQAPASVEQATDEYEAVDDGADLAPLDFKPLILSKATLLAILVFYLAIIGAIGTLVYYENNSRVFRVNATASRFTVRFLPPIIGTISTTLFRAVHENYARMMPYIRMADQVRHTDQTGKRSIMARTFPLVDVPGLQKNQEWLALSTLVSSIIGNFFIAPLKSSLIIKQASVDDPNAWSIRIYSGVGKTLLAVYAGLSIVLTILIARLWNAKTGLRWDPVSLADWIGLFNRSNTLDLFQGGEFNRIFRGPQYLESLMGRTRHRLGYWRSRNTGELTYGIRTIETPEYLRLQDEAAQSALPNVVHGCKEILTNPRLGHRATYWQIHPVTGIVVFFISAGLTGCGVYVLISGRLRTGFNFPSDSDFTAALILRFLPAFLVVFFAFYWYHADIYHRGVQPFLNMRSPVHAQRGLLMTYSCDVIGVVSVKALWAGHWRLALLTIMPQIQLLLVIYVGTIFIASTSSEPNTLHITLDTDSFYVTWAIIILYTLVALFAIVRRTERMPWIPSSIADFAMFFYSSTLVQNRDFALQQLHHEQWHMHCRVLLAERRYMFGLFEGADGLVHFGIEDAYCPIVEDVSRSSPASWPRKEQRRVAPMWPQMSAFRRPIARFFVQLGTLFDRGKYSRLQQEDREGQEAHAEIEALVENLSRAIDEQDHDLIHSGANGLDAGDPYTQHQGPQYNELEQEEGN